MFNVNSKSRLNRIAATAVVAVMMSASSFTAPANDTMVQDTFSVLEQNITQASQDLLLSAKQEFVLSLRTQIAEQIFDVKTDSQAHMLASDDAEQSVTTASKE
ncbi:hypothetical protein [Shewanella subflava]|uniref:Uncharacterized protein n=1 Tax=Shewanella subflava TaxID=2986476 RepID=A0ABT3I644_9GAMM|nr:hypothetical protein [Shewanella subflava]MCW3171444.1 hypothetical protein [Shewanella subflava]